MTMNRIAKAFNHTFVEVLVFSFVFSSRSIDTLTSLLPEKGTLLFQLSNVGSSLITSSFLSLLNLYHGVQLLQGCIQNFFLWGGGGGEEIEWVPMCGKRLLTLNIAYKY